MINKIIQIFKVKELRDKILFVLGAFAIFRLMANIPMPGINPDRMGALFETLGILKFASALTGGALDKFSIVMLGLGPYITATIVLQLMTMVIPALERLQKEEGDAGRQKINQYGRILTIPFALVQGFGMMTLFQNQGVIDSLSPMGMMVSLFTIAAGTVLLMWIGELITQKGIGNGVSLLIFAGIIADFPNNTRNMIVSIVDYPGAIQSYLLLFLMAVITLIGVVYFNEARRNIPVSYAKRVRGKKMYGGVSTYLPLNLNPAGVIPIIFAFAIAFLPSMIGQFLSGIGGVIGSVSIMVVGLFSNLWVLVVLSLYWFFFLHISIPP